MIEAAPAGADEDGAVVATGAAVGAAVGAVVGAVVAVAGGGGGTAVGGGGVGDGGAPQAPSTIVATSKVAIRKTRDVFIGSSLLIFSKKS